MALPESRHAFARLIGRPKKPRRSTAVFRRRCLAWRCPCAGARSITKQSPHACAL